MLHPLRFSFSLSPFCLFLPSFFTPFFFSCVYIYPMLCPLLRSCNAICLPYSTLIPSLIFGLKFILCCVLVLTAPSLSPASIPVVCAMAVRNCLECQQHGQSGADSGRGHKAMQSIVGAAKSMPAQASLLTVCCQAVSSVHMNM